MRASQWFNATLKETPHDAEISSHQLMLRAGMIRKLALGLYTWLPLGLKVLRKVEAIVREEMNKAGSLELLMPAVQPAELWQETGRWDTFGNQLLTMQDNNERLYCFGPTHEEVITDLMRDELRSYKQLPMNCYQIQTKFRDEIRPRFGVMRAREFIMKDAYSFHSSDACLQATYDDMYTAYSRVFTRLGLTFRAVEADTGAIGGAVSHEFQVLADSGEDIIFYSNGSDYAANAEQATYFTPTAVKTPYDKPLETIATPGQKTIAALTDSLGVAAKQTVKTLLVKGEEDPIVALVLRGDDELNEIKAGKHPRVRYPLAWVDEEEAVTAFGAHFGSLGPVGLSIPIIVDHNALAINGFICGANQDDYHYQHVCWHRDVGAIEPFDLRLVQEGDKSPDGKGTLKACRGIEVGHIFQLGRKYAEAMRATILDEQGKQQTLTMGCYGLGISRIVAAAIEQHHDDRGIVWPSALAPFQVIIIPINGHRNEEVTRQAELIYQSCLDLGIDVLLDDRKERAGVLFADSDLIGIPHRIVISDKLLASDELEYKARSASDNQRIARSDLDALLADIQAG